MPLNKGYAEKIDVMIFYDLRYQNAKKFGFRNFALLLCTYKQMKKQQVP